MTGIAQAVPFLCPSRECGDYVMARPRNPKRDEAYKIYADSGGTIKLTDLARQLDIPASRIRKWKTEDQWERSDSNQKERSFSNGAKKELKKKLFKSADAAAELTDKQRDFCVFYASSNNATQAYLKAYGGDKAVAMVEGCRLLRNPKIKTEIHRLKELMRSEYDLELDDLIRYCLKVVGADAGDFVRFGRRDVPVMGEFGPIIDKNTKKPIMRTISYVDMAESAALDTSVLTEVKQGKDGVSFKLADKKWAWEKLEKYLGFDEAAKLQADLQNQKLQAEVDALKNSQGNDDRIEITIRKKESRDGN